MNYYNELKRKTLTNAEKDIVVNFFSTYFDYISTVENHIFQGNEIRNDKYADIEEKQEKLKSLDTIRTAAHNKYLSTVTDFAHLYTAKTGLFLPLSLLRNRATMADLGAMLCYDIARIIPKDTSSDGELRDELANDIHGQIITIDNLKSKIKQDFNIVIN
jgi:hypothetical protein